MKVTIHNPTTSMLVGKSTANTGVEVDAVAVVCNGMQGLFLTEAQSIVCRCLSCSRSCPDGSRVMSPTEFERHAGMAASKKWRRSIKIDSDDLSLSLGRWLEQQGVKVGSTAAKGKVGSDSGQSPRERVNDDDSSDACARESSQHSETQAFHHASADLEDGAHTNGHSRYTDYQQCDPEVWAAADALEMLRSGLSSPSSEADSDDFHPGMLSSYEPSRRPQRTHKPPTWLQGSVHHLQELEHGWASRDNFLNSCSKALISAHRKLHKAESANTDLDVEFIESALVLAQRSSNDIVSPPHTHTPCLISAWEGTEDTAAYEQGFCSVDTVRCLPGRHCSLDPTGKRFKRAESDILPEQPATKVPRLPAPCVSDWKSVDSSQVEVTVSCNYGTFCGVLRADGATQH